MRGGRRNDPNGNALQGRHLERLPPEATRAHLEALRAPGESWAALAARLGVPRQAVGRALAVGITERQLGEWRLKAG